MKTIGFVILVSLYLLHSAKINAQTGLPNTTAVVQNFNAMAATTTLPSNWRMAASTTSPTWSGAATTVTQQASTGSPTTGGTYNWGSTASERAVGAMTSGSFGSPNSLIGFFQNTGSTAITKLTVSYKGERYRINTAAASVQFYYSSNGTSWTAVTAGDIATASFPTAASSYTLASPLTITVAAFDVTTSIAVNGSIYLRWNLNTTGTNSQGIGIDDISVTATFVTPCSVPTSVSVNNLMANAADISWPVVSGVSGYEYQLSSSATPSSGTPTTSTSFNATSLTASTKYYFHVRSNCAGTYSVWKTDSFTTSASTEPVINILDATLVFGNVVNGGVSSEKNYRVSGRNLTSGITINAPSGFGVSLSSGTGYQSSLILSQSAGVVDTTLIYVIYTNGSDSGSLSANITHTSAGATDNTIAVSVNRIATEPITGSTITFGAKTSVSLVLNFSGGTGQKRVVVARASSAVSYVPQDGSSVTGVNAVFTSATDQGSGNKIVLNGTASTVTVSGLSANTTYHFAVYEYNEGTGTSQNYRAATTANTTTLDLAIYLADVTGATYTENFNTIGASATAALPNGFQVSGATSTPVYGTAVTTAATQSFGSTGTGAVSSASSGGFINWANGVAASSSDRALGLLSSGSYASPRSLMSKITNTSGDVITSLLVTYNVEKYRSGSRAMDVDFYFSTTGSAWTAKKTSSFAADAGNATVFDPPQSTTESVVISGISVANNASFYLRWDFEGVGGSTNSQGIGVDDITITPFTTTGTTTDNELDSGTYDNLNVVDNTILQGDVTISGKLNMVAGARLVLNGYTLTVAGDLTGTLLLEGDTNSSLVISGSGDLSDISFHQGTAGSSNRLANLTLNRIGSTLELTNEVQVSGLVRLSSGTLSTGGNLVLLSDASSTAGIPAIPAGADITGNVTVQRYIPAVVRRSRMLSSPVSSFSFDQFIDDMYLSGTGGASNGFDASPSNSNSIYTYQESNTGSGRGWKSISVIGATMNPGEGALVFVRGDRSIGSTAWYTSPYPAQNEVVIDYESKPINKGTISPVITYTSTGIAGDDGWNLVGNPYPSSIDWKLLTKQNLAAFYYTYDPVTGSYIADNGDNLIASGQAFFVQATAPSPVITFNESAKKEQAPVAYFKKQNRVPLQISMKKDNLNADVAWLSFREDAVKAYNKNEDAIKLSNATINLSFCVDSVINTQFNAVPPATVSDTFVMSASAASGTYNLIFSNVAEALDISRDITLVDLFTNSRIDVKVNSSYSFSITSDPLSSGKRFLLLIGAPSSLPVKIISFSGVADNNIAKLSWSCVNEKNIAQYFVQHSTDGSLFTDLFPVKANNKSNKQVYTCNAILIPGEINYYRLIVAEKNGAATATDKIAIRKIDEKTDELLVIPNPAQQHQEINVSGLFTPEQEVYVRIYNSAGVIIKQFKHIATIRGLQQISLNEFEPGLYYIAVQTEKGELRSKFVVR